MIAVVYIIEKSTVRDREEEVGLTRKLETAIQELENESRTGPKS